jgi:hypothetical protein
MLDIVIHYSYVWNLSQRSRHWRDRFSRFRHNHPDIFSRSKHRIRTVESVRG